MEYKFWNSKKHTIIVPNIIEIIQLSEEGE